jgi:hypothetical protein
MRCRLGAVVLALSAASVVAEHPARADGATAEACATASDNAQPLRNASKLRAARQQLLVCVSPRCPAIVRNDCASQLTQLESTIPTVVFAATDPSGQDLSAVRVKMDGEQLADHLDGTSLAADPGVHVFVFEADGFPPVTKKLVLREGEKDRHVSLVFGTPAHPPSSASTKAPAHPPPESHASAPRWPAYVAFGIGGAGLILGLVFTGSAINQNSTLAKECTFPNEGCDPKYQPDIDSLHTDQVVAGIGYGVALVGAAFGTYVLISSVSSQGKGSGRGPDVQVTPRIGFGWLGMEGQFR